MTKILVYQNDKKILENEIKDEYYFVEAYDGSEELYFFENYPQGIPPNQIRVWLRSTSTKPDITVMPDWKLVINNVEMSRKAYVELSLNFGDVIDLFYKNYRFNIEL